MPALSYCTIAHASLPLFPSKKSPLFFPSAQAMAVDNSSVPKDLRSSVYPGRVHAPPPGVSIAPSTGSLPLSSSATVAAAKDLSSRKVKLLCSFGGRILPRPTGGTLRYAGGHTRIISLRKDISFAEFVSKMSEAVGTAAVAVKYQLPGEDLDALISVSCPEDLVNLMEEYDKLAAASPDGSFKLRAFLFSPSELASADAALHHGAADVVDQGYVDALNGFSVSDGSRGLRSNSFTSIASSTPNSEGTTVGDATEDGTGVGMSPSFPSATDSRHDAPRLVYVGGNNPTMAPDAAIGIPGGAALPPGMSFAAQNPSWGRREMPPMAPYMAPSYVEHHQLHYVTPQHLGMVGGLHNINVVPYTVHTFVPNGVPSPTNLPSMASHIDNLQPVQARLVPNLDNPYGGKGLQSLSQLPPLPPTFTPSPLLQPQARLEDCLMCQKELPHAHSDTLIQEHGIGSLDSFGEQTTTFYSQRSVPLGTGTLVNNFPGLNVENMNTTNQLAGSLLPHVPDVQHANIRPQRPDEENSSNQRLLVDNYMQRQLVNPLQLQQHQVWETLQPPPHLIKQEIVTSGLPNEESLLLQQLQAGQQPNCMVRQEGVLDPSDVGVYANYYSAKPTTQLYAHQITDENAELVESRIEALGLDPPRATGTTHQGKPATTHTDAPSYLVAENSHNVGPQFGDSTLSTGNAGWNFRYVVPDGNYSKPIEQGTLRSSEYTQLQRLQNEQNANMIMHHDPFPYNLGISGYAGHVNTLENDEPVGHDNMIPPRAGRIVSKEFAAPSHRAVGSDIVSMLEEGNFHHPPDTMIKDFCFGPARLLKEEENIKQQLQTVAEDVAALVFQPPVPSASPAPETKNLAPEINNEMSGTPESKEPNKIVPDEEIEDSVSKQLNQKNHGINLSEDMGRLQIIKNSDLEELQELGSGTFGIVHRGKWRGTDVAIKMINDGCFAGKKSEEERMRADFWNEASKLADLHHPNVVAFYGVVLDGPGGSIATVTEYMVNGSLQQALQQNHKAFDWRQRYLIAMDVAFGMEYLHVKSIVHFDLKSDNLLVNLRDRYRPICKVGDLGLSKVKCRTLISGGMRGTLPWMAPELLYGNDSLVSEKVDVFSFGIVMWEIMTGEEPYADLHYGAIIGGILSNTLRPPVPESSDSEWRTLMEQCWSAEPSERPSFTEIANRLRCMASALSHKAQQHQAAEK